MNICTILLLPCWESALNFPFSFQITTSKVLMLDALLSAVIQNKNGVKFDVLASSSNIVLMGTIYSFTLLQHVYKNKI